jgi:hypothetical protein
MANIIAAPSLSEVKNDDATRLFEDSQSVKNQSSDLRIKSAMVLFALEESLGGYVTENSPDLDDLPSGIRASIQSRVKEPGEPIAVKHIVQSTYISELLDLAMSTSKHRADGAYLNRLKELSESLGLFEIRNAVCHPNRPFAECYWHRMATIATDPAVKSLQLKRVEAAFNAAQHGRIESPPEDWLTRSVSAVANNLPDAFDHAITGLIGREKEANELRDRLRRHRFALIAIVGPGGTGKTALCQEVLSECRYDPATLDWTDEIVYITAKLERLTATGIESISNPVDSIADVKQYFVSVIANSNNLSPDARFEDIVDALSGRRILLCLDNLETLLRDHPTAFDEFYSGLPKNWRVLITSRVPVDSATVMSIQTISENAATRLARDYLAKRGGDRLPEETLRRLAEACDCNPLAIRLVIDGYLAGTPLEDALRHTKEGITKFSYTRLIEALPNQAVEILECLFAVGNPVTRPQIGHLLAYGTDRVAEGVGSLLRTSLITRHTDDDIERYSLSSSIRELLLRNPLNQEIRGHVYDRLRHQQETVGVLDRSSVLDPLAWDFVPQDCSDQVRTTAYEAFKAIQRKAPVEELLRHRDLVAEQLQRIPDEPVLLRAASYLYLQLNDRYYATQMLSQAVKCHAGDPASDVALAELHLNDRRLDEAYLVSKRLILNGWDDPSKSSLNSAIRVLKAHWLPAIWTGKHFEAIKACTNWKEHADLRPTKASIYVSAMKRRLEADQNSQQRDSLITEMLHVLDYTFSTDGYIGFLVHEGMRVVDEVYMNCRRFAPSKKCSKAISDFVEKHLLAMSSVHHTWKLDHEKVRQWFDFFASLNVSDGENPLRSDRWLDILDNKEDEALANYGYRTVEVYARPRLSQGVFQRYLFARGSDGTQYFVAERATSVSSSQFDEIRVGDRLSVLPQDVAVGEKATPVRDAILI